MTPKSKPSRPPVGEFDFIAERVDHPEAAGARALIGIWSRIRSGHGRLPAQDDFALSDLRHLAAHTAIVEVDDTRAGAERYINRRTGTVVDELLKRPVTGLRVSDTMFGAMADQTHEIFDGVLRAGEPACYLTRFLAQDKDWYTVEIVVLPITGPKGKGQRIMTGWFRSEPAPSLG